MKELVRNMLATMVGILIIILMIGIPFLTGVMLLMLFLEFVCGLKEVEESEVYIL
ncbi:hypothetical protein [uncultured Phascolarctobacterium sp.]|uniref:hypothetical protein n=1 Tax=uncultured Phascolarctobacterium sp. TaxID=512296 RepID=UPI0025F62C87|nr:hypothetical protein [uncultured Phascolarctobacterium sp.]